MAGVGGYADNDGPLAGGLDGAYLGAGRVARSGIDMGVAMDKAEEANMTMVSSPRFH